MYLRYVASYWKSQNPWNENGLLSFANLEIKLGYLAIKSDVKEIKKIFKWYNDNIPCPPFEKMIKKKKWTADAIAWWKPTAKDAISQMKKLSVILRSYGYKVKLMKSKRPGKIVYEDEFQIVAEIPKSKKWIPTSQSKQKEWMQKK